MSSTREPQISHQGLPGMRATCRRVLRETVVCGGLVLLVALGGMGVEVTWAQSAGEPRPAEGTAQTHLGPAPAAQPANGVAVVEVERPDTIEAERPPAPPEAHSGDTNSTAAPSAAHNAPEAPSPATLQPRGPRVDLVPAESPLASRLGNDSPRDRVVLGHDLLAPGQRSPQVLRAKAEVNVAPSWAREDSRLSLADGTLVLRSRRFSSPEEAWDDLTTLAVSWLRQKYEPETGRSIADPVGVLRQEPDLELVQQRYVQNIALNDGKVLEAPMYIAHLRLPVTDSLRQFVYADWRAQLVQQRLLQLVGGAALLSGVLFISGRALRT